MALIRLQKYLADCGVASRRKAEEFIQQGLVKINGEITTKLGTKIDSEKDRVEYKGKTVTPAKFVYLMLNKPKGYVTTLSQPGKKIISELVHLKERVFPVGRLDKESEGLLILTNDGDLTYKLTHPKFEHEKEYLVTVDREISPLQIKNLEQGIVIDEKKTWPAKVKKLSDKSFTIILHEGRNRQVRKMCEAIGLQVLSLKRIRIGPLKLANLELGTWRFLTKEEIRKLKINLRNNPKASSSQQQPSRPETSR